MFHRIATGDGDSHRVPDARTQRWVLRAVDTAAHAYEHHVTIRHGAHQRIFHQFPFRQTCSGRSGFGLGAAATSREQDGERQQQNEELI